MELDDDISASRLEMFKEIGKEFKELELHNGMQYMIDQLNHVFGLIETNRMPERFSHRLLDAVRVQEIDTFLKILSETPGPAAETPGIDLNATDGDGNTLLHLTAREQYEPWTTKFLLICGAEPNAVNENDETALFVSIYSYSWEQERKTKLLIRGMADINLRAGGSERTILDEAVRIRDVDRVQHLIRDYDADPNVGAMCQISPLQLAAEQGNANMIMALVEGGAEIDRKDDFLKTALFSAAEAGHIQVVRLLLLLGSNPFLLVPDDNSTELRSILACVMELTIDKQEIDTRDLLSVYHMLALVDRLVLARVKEYHKNYIEQSVLAVMMGTHQRTGMDSILNIVEPGLFKEFVCAQIARDHQDGWEGVEPERLKLFIRQAVAEFDNVEASV